MPKNFVGEPFCVSEDFRYRESLWVGGVGDATTIFCPKFFVTQCRKSSLGNILRFQKNSVIESFHALEGRTAILRLKFCVAHCRNFCRGILQCFTIFGYRKFLCMRGVCQDFLSKYFSLTVPENLVAEPFCVSELFWYRINLWIRGGPEYHDFPSEIFCRTVLKNS